MFGGNERVGKSYFDTYKSDELAVSVAFATLQGEGPYSGRRAVFLRLSKCLLSCHFCFPSSKTINTVNRGRVRMDQLVEGDVLWTLGRNKELTTTKVTKTFTNPSTQDDLVRVVYKKSNGLTDSIVCTKDHPFDVKGKNWVAAGKLVKNDVVFHVEGNEIVSYIKTHINNPMWDKKVAKKVAKTSKAQFASGERIPYERTDTWRKNQSDRMANDNPMWDMGARYGMICNKIYPKSKFEKECHRIFKNICPDIRYVGNSKKHIIGSNSSGYMRPDFVIKNTKKVIEVYDPTFKGYARSTKKEQRVYERSRTKHYNKFGYTVEFFKRDEFNWKIGNGKGNVPTFDKVKYEIFLDKFNKFWHNGIKIIKVEPISDHAYRAIRTACGGKLTVSNVECAPYNHYLIDGIHVHNCDTAFEDITKYQFEDLHQYLISKATDWMDKYAPHYDSRVPLDGWGLVITGGEPMLQTNLWKFVERLEDGYHPTKRFDWIQIETTGTQPWKEDYSDETTVVVSPKCVEKNGIVGKHMLPHRTILERANCLKFVISADQNSPYSTIPDWALNWKAETGKRIYLSPLNEYNREPKAMLLAAKTSKQLTIEQREALEKISFWEGFGTDDSLLNMESNKKNHEYTALLCMKYNCVLSLQTHLFASLP